MSSGEDRRGLRTTRSDPDGRQRLRHEASILRSLHHPAVTRVVDLRDDENTTELVTAPATPASLAEAPPTTASQIVATMASLATTVADLHGLGIAHGALDPGCVRITDQGAPVLGGFGAAGPIGSIPSRLPTDPTGFWDPARRPDDPLSPDADVYALGALLDHLLEQRPRAKLDADRRLDRRLHRLAGRAMTHPPPLRPDAADFAAALLELLPDASFSPIDPANESAAPDRPTSLRRPTLRHAPRLSGRTTRRLAFVTVSTAVMVAATLVIAHRSDAPAATGIPPTIAPTTAPTTTPVTTSAPMATPVTVATTPPALLVAFDGRTYRLEQGSRRWAIGDWDCDGTSTIAAIEPSNGDIYIFDAWPTSGALTAEPTRRLEGGIDVEAHYDPRVDCHRLVVVNADGSRSVAAEDRR